jgi:MinD-like ATPase involved in chromosome partitioning or flagellar assembly
VDLDDGVRPSVVQDALQRDVFWNIPYDKKVRQGTHLGQPIVITAPQSIAAKSLTDLAGPMAEPALKKTVNVPEVTPAATRA